MESAQAFHKVQSSFLLDFCYLGSYQQVYWFLCCWNSVDILLFMWAFLFFNLGNLTFCTNRMTFEIVSLPCLLLCYHSVQLHSHCVYVVKIASSLPMPFYCLPAHSPEMDSLTNTKGCSFSALC